LSTDWKYLARMKHAVFVSDLSAITDDGVGASPTRAVF
jgi:hypothetical protein